jgi:hypothetical protein
VGIMMAGADNMLGGILTRAEAREIPFFQPGGRRPFFGDTFASTYLCNQRAGLMPFCRGGADASILLWSVWVAISLTSGWWLIRSGRLRSWMERNRLTGVSEGLAGVIGPLVMSGLLLFPIAHFAALRLHNPERFGRYTIELSFALIIATTAAAVGLTLWARSRSMAQRTIRFALVAVCAGGFILWSAVQPDRITIVRTDAPEVYDFLRDTERGVLVASVLQESDNLPAFASRSTFVSMQLLTLGNRNYFTEMRERLVGLSGRLYSADGASFNEFAARHGIDYVLVERDPADAIATIGAWARSFPELEAVHNQLSGGQQPFFRALATVCSRVEAAEVLLLEVKCLAERTSNSTTGM